MGTDIFSPAIEYMRERSIAVFGPKSFQGYLTEFGFPKRATAAQISIDSHERLPQSLKDSGIMVLRLGVSRDSEKRETQFVLVDRKPDDYFLFDKETSDPRSTYLPKVSMRDLFAYQVLPVFTETSLVNLALASGLMSYALDLDQERSIVNPATGRSVFSFKLKLHSSIEEAYLHDEGQVELDSIFLGHRGEKDILFVLEAKSKYRSLAKHKLVYPILAIASTVPGDIEIIPVYMKISKSEEGFHFKIFECKLPDARERVVAIDELSVNRRVHLVLPRLSML